MAWNQPGNNGQDRDPWGSRNKKGANPGIIVAGVIRDPLI
ncbi:protease modulator HflK N-terminal domain-containing protein [Tatumella ptyseos]|uniref:Modulator of FtsH protease HflK n=1 Tax=Tatumella ptyseos TaxID=82987 RepID=A0A2X5PJ07_9GAMM|nr:Modulator of FtsH protease HflK [Tatumella ptyseos]